MALKNTNESYGWLAKTLHWLIAFAIIALLIVGNLMTGMERGEFRGTIYGIHKSTGILVLALVIARVCWRMVNIQPTHAQLARWQRLSAHGVHYALYACMFLMPLSGWGMSSAGGHAVSFYGLFTVPPLVAPDKELGGFFNGIHFYVSWLMVALLVAHIGAALLHHFYYKDRILKRMLP